jgi:hypothetical protein
MSSSLLDSLSLIDLSGRVIIAAIVVTFLISIACTFVSGRRYAGLLQALDNALPGHALADPVLDRIVTNAVSTVHEHPRDVNHQAIVEHEFQAQLRPLLTAERFVKASGGLVIILGLVGTFYGLTLSIGKLVHLVTGEQLASSGMTRALTRGLSDALSGMSVAFTTSLFGIVAAILLTLIGVFFSVTDRRTSVMVQIETYLDRLLSEQAAAVRGPSLRAGAGGGAGAPDPQLASIVAHFGQSVAQLQGAVGHFETALESFATTTRDFREFNLHLKDNVQRMSLSFADFSDSLRANAHDPNRPLR